MDTPSIRIRKEGRHFLKWPSRILHAINLKQNSLKGSIQARLKNKLIYFPVYFQSPDSMHQNLILEATFLPDTDLSISANLRVTDSQELIKHTENIEMTADREKTIYWKVDSKILGKGKFINLEVTKKDSKIGDNFYIYWN